MVAHTEREDWFKSLREANRGLYGSESTWRTRWGAELMIDGPRKRGEQVRGGIEREEIMRSVAVLQASASVI